MICIFCELYCDAFILEAKEKSLDHSSKGEIMLELIETVLPRKPNNGNTINVSYHRWMYILGYANYLIITNDINQCHGIVTSENSHVILNNNLYVQKVIYATQHM